MQATNFFTPQRSNPFAFLAATADGALLTFALFILMAELISNDARPEIPPEIEPFGPIVLNIEEPDIKRPIIKPQPEPVPPPAFTQQMAPDAETSTSFKGPVATYTQVKMTIGNNINAQKYIEPSK